VSRLTLLWVVLLTVACSQSEPGRTLFGPNAREVKFHQTWVRGSEQNAPWVQTGLVAGERFITAIGNPGDVAVTVAIDGAATDSRILPPLRWTPIASRALAAEIGFRWEGGPLLFGPVHVPSARETPSVLLVSIDTLRADALADMPRLSALAEQGVVFENARTPTPWTLPAHVSMLSGSYPNRHGVRLPDQKIPGDLSLLPELALAAGYHTLAVTEGNYVSATYGFNRGFHGFTENPPLLLENDPRSVSKLADNLTLLEEDLARTEGMSRFVFFHTYEVHCPYLPHDGLADPEGLGGTQWLLDNDGSDLSEQTLSHLRALYRSEVAYVDRTLTPLLEELVSRGNWIVVITSDHGEEFGEHGGLLHADTLYEETMRVPLIILGSDQAPRRVTEAATLVDIAPTIARMLGWPVPESWQGRDLFDARATPLPSFGESFFFGPQIATEDPRLAGIWKGDDKLVQTRNFGRFRAELYNLLRDPAETDDLSDRDLERRDALFIFLERYLKDQPLDPASIEGLSPEQIETMRSLGYID